MAKISRDSAEVMAANALGFLAEDEDRFGDFLALTGLSPDDVRSQVNDPTFLAGVMQYMVENERLLVEFASSADLIAEAVAEAAQALGVHWE